MTVPPAVPIDNLRLPVLMRAAAVLFSLVAFVAAWGWASLGSTVRSTLHDADWVEGVLVEARLIDVVYDELLPAALGDLGTRGVSLAGDAAPPLRLSPEAATDLAEALERLLPRRWLRRTTARAAAAWLPALAGPPQRNAVELELAGRWNELPPTVRWWTSRARFGHQALDQIVAPLFAQAADQLITPPLGLAFDEAQAREMAGRIAPPEWIDDRLVEASRSIVPCLEDSALRCDVRIELSGRVELAMDLFEQELTAAGAVRRLVFDRFVDRWIAEALVDGKRTASPLELSEPQIRRAVREAMSERWLRAKTGAVVGSLEAFLTGEQRTLRWSIDLSDRKQSLARELESEALGNLEQWFASTDACSLFELRRAAADLAAGRMPSCLPASRAIVRSMVRPSIERRVAASVEPLPEQLVFDEPQIRRLLGSAATGRLRELRGVVTDGWLVGSIAPASEADRPASWRAVLGWIRRDRISLDDLRRWPGGVSGRALPGASHWSLQRPAGTALGLVVALLALVLLYRSLRGTPQHRLRTTMLAVGCTPWAWILAVWLVPSPAPPLARRQAAAIAADWPGLAQALGERPVVGAFDAVWSAFLRAWSLGLALSSAIAFLAIVLALRRSAP